jgi:hypothetical protein
VEMRFNLAEILTLAVHGLTQMREENPDMPEILAVAPHFDAIGAALAFTEPKCLADYTVSLDILDTFEP